MPTTKPNQSPTAARTTGDQRPDDTQLHVRQRRAFHLHASVFAVSMVIIFLVNLATNVAANLTGEWSAWWSAWALLGWGLGVAIHGLVVRLARPQSFGSR